MRETTLAIQEQKNRTKQRRERRQETKESFHITSSVNLQLRRIRLTNTAGLPADTCGPSGTHAQMRLILHCIRVQSRSEILVQHNTHSGNKNMRNSPKLCRMWPNQVDSLGTAQQLSLERDSGSSHSASDVGWTLGSSSSRCAKHDSSRSDIIGLRLPNIPHKTEQVPEPHFGQDCASESERSSKVGLSLLPPSLLFMVNEDQRHVLHPYSPVPASTVSLLLAPWW